MSIYRYKVELANKIERGQAVGNLYGVARYLLDGRRNTYVLEPQGDEALAYQVTAALNQQASSAHVALTRAVLDKLTCGVVTREDVGLTCSEAALLSGEIARLRAVIQLARPLLEELPAVRGVNHVVLAAISALEAGRP